jgi:sugar phosphate isomerase/epimerase
MLAAARKVGLAVTSAFIDWRAIALAGQPGVPTFDAILEAGAKLELKYLVFGYVGKGSRETADQLKVLAERANRAGEKCRQANIQFCYHNHAFEFQKLPGGQTGFEVFVAEFDRDLVKFEVDVFWVAIGGLDPLKTIRQLEGRVAQLHLKDLLAGTGTIYDESRVPHEAFKELGNGIIDMAAVLQAGEAAGAAQCHVEQDQSPDPIRSIGQSLKYLRELPAG